jgi:glyoxylase-like metal-dependent hydrolase (beta-lactamase superfamily II)
MSYRNAVIFGTLVLLFAAPVLAETIDGLTLHIERLSDKAVRVWLGDYVSSTSVIALATEKGIVVVDTTGNWRADAELRKVIARELGRSDFKYLINTHEHGDHTYGNQVYSDCVIIAHETCAEGIKASLERQAEIIAWYKERLPQMKDEYKKLQPDSEEAKKALEELYVLKAALRDRESGYEPTMPTKTFTDRMELDMGDMTLELYYAGGVHSASDIFVFVPEQGLLLTGDTMADIWLTDSPGCLTSFMIRRGVKQDFPLLLKNWEALIAKKDEIKDYIPGHWNGDLTFEGFQNRYNYVKTLWEGINFAVKDGQTLEQQFQTFSLAGKFPELVGSPGITAQTNGGSIIALWANITKAEPAGAALFTMINEYGADEGIKRLMADHAKHPTKYLFTEAEINSLGYAFLNEGKIKKAIAVFKLNVGLYPESWNVYDSLAEGYMNDGDTELAISYYEKSLEINPNNENGKQMLERIQTTRAAQSAQK